MPALAAGFERHVVTQRHALHQVVELCARVDPPAHAFALRTADLITDPCRIFRVERMCRDERLLPRPRNWAMTGGSGGSRAVLVRRRPMPGVISSLPGTAGLPPFISSPTGYPELSKRSAPPGASLRLSLRRGMTVLTPVCRQHTPVLRQEFTVICAMRHEVAPAQQVRHGANEVRSWLS